MSTQTRAMIELLVVIINLFVARFGLNSKNSSIPPSKDPNRPRGAKAKGKGKKRKPGGQKGHNGSTLKKVDKPDRIEPIEIDRRTIPSGEYKQAGYES
jgi:transposase